MFRQVLYVLAIAMFTSPLLFSDEWLSFRGPNGDGKSPDTGLQQQWAPEGPTLLWTADIIGFGYSGVSISDGRIFTTGNVGDLSMVFALDMEGNLIWENDNGPAVHTADHPNARNYPGTRGNVTISGNAVYDFSAIGNLTCFDATTGDKIWSKNVREEYNAPLPFWLFGHAPIIDGDHLITLVGGSETLAVALNKRTGETVWRSAPVANGAPAGYTTPYLFEFAGTRIVAVMSNVSVEGLDAATGRTLFSIPWSNQRNVHCTMPIYHDGHLFLSTGYDGGSARLFRLTKNANDTISATQQWVNEQFNNHHGGVVLVGNYVYGTNHAGSWIAINFMTGDIGYTNRSPIATKGSVLYADGLLYGLTERDKTVLLIRPVPNRFVLVSDFELPNDGEGNSWAHPVVIGGRMYLRHGRYLYCYDVAFFCLN